MVICIVAMVVFGILGIFSARYRKIAKEAFSCVSRMATFRPCETGFDDKVRSHLTSKIMKRSERLAGWFYRNFKAISLAFTITFFLSAGYTAYTVYNLAVYGTCDPQNPQKESEASPDFIELQLVFDILFAQPITEPQGDELYLGLLTEIDVRHFDLLCLVSGRVLGRSSLGIERARRLDLGIGGRRGLTRSLTGTLVTYLGFASQIIRAEPAAVFTKIPARVLAAEFQLAFAVW